MPPAFALSQDQTLRFIPRTTSRPSGYEPPCTHSLTDNYPSHPKQPDTKPHHPRHQPLSEPTPGRRPRIPPLTTSSPPSSHQHQKAVTTAISQPSTQPSINRTAKNQTLPKPMQLSKNNPPKPAGHHPSRGNNQPPERNRPISGPTNLVTPRPPVNPPHQRRGGASMPLPRTGQPPFRQERYHSAKRGIPASIEVRGA